MPVRSWSSIPSERCPRTGAVSPLDETFTFLPSVPIAPRSASRPEKVCSSLVTTVRHALCRTGLQGLAPRIESVRVHQPASRPAMRPWLSWVSTPLQGSPCPPRAWMLPPGLLPRAWLALVAFVPAKDLHVRSSDSPAPRSIHKDRIGRVLRVRDTPSWGFSTSSTLSAIGVQPSPGSLFHLGVRCLIAGTSKHPLRACAAGD